MWRAPDDTVRADWRSPHTDARIRDMARLRAEVGDAPVTRVLATSHQRTACPGETLVHIGQPRRVGFLVLGLLKAVAYFPDGQSPTVHYIQDGTFFGLCTLFYPASMSIHVVKAASVIDLDGPTVVRVAQDFPAFGWFVSRELAAAALRLPTTAEQFGFRTMLERVAGHLIRLSNTDGPSAVPVAHVTQESLADSVGSVREVVWRCLRLLRDEGLIAVAPRAITVLDQAGLARRAAPLDPQAFASTPELDTA